MNNSDFLKSYYHLQKDIMYDSLEPTSYGFLVTCNDDIHQYWNNALLERNITQDELRAIETQLQKYNRTPAVYFENTPEFEQTVQLLLQENYKKISEDSWMFYEHSYLDTSSFKNIKQVENEQELQIYIETLNACYKKDDPTNPYGELGSYLTAAKDDWLKIGTTGKLQYFIAYQENTPVAVATLTTSEKIGYISNVGSLTTVRGKGFGKAITLYCVYQSIQKGNTSHCLATEEGTNPNQFYKNLGFQTKFTALCYSK